jgi:nitroreductase
MRDQAGEKTMFMDLIRSRRSIRRFAAKPVEAEKIEALMEAALRSPSSRGCHPWEFIVVSDRGLLADLAKAKPHGADFLKSAALGIVVCGDPHVSDVWVEDTAIATIFLHLAAASLGLGSCWIQIRARMHADGRPAQDYIAERLKIPSHLAVEAMLAVGYPAENKRPHPAERLQREKISYQFYGRKAP